MTTIKFCNFCVWKFGWTVKIGDECIYLNDAVFWTNLNCINQTAKSCEIYWIIWMVFVYFLMHLWNTTIAESWLVESSVTSLDDVMSWLLTSSVWRPMWYRCNATWKNPESYFENFERKLNFPKNWLNLLLCTLLIRIWLRSSYLCDLL